MLGPIAIVVATVASVVALVAAATHTTLAVVREGRTLTVPSIGFVVLFAGPVLYAGSYWMYGELLGITGYVVAMVGGIGLVNATSSNN